MGKCVCVFTEDTGKGSVSLPLHDDMQRTERCKRSAGGGRGGGGVQGW